MPKCNLPDANHNIYPRTNLWGFFPPSTLWSFKYFSPYSPYSIQQQSATYFSPGKLNLLLLNIPTSLKNVVYIGIRTVIYIYWDNKNACQKKDQHKIKCRKAVFLQQQLKVELIEKLMSICPECVTCFL
jgi:hypothetical protein